MGVRGLTTFLGDYSILERIQISDQCLVFDGCSLIFYLYSELNARIRLFSRDSVTLVKATLHNTWSDALHVAASFTVMQLANVWTLLEIVAWQLQCGGDYGKYRRIILKFFANLKDCNIFSVVVLDGAFDIHKRSTHLYRLENYAQSLALFMDGEVVQGKDFLPILAGEVFQQILEELRIPFVYALHDADRDVAAVANVLSAFVVSKDSDFYVLPLKHGYISLNDLAWQQVCSDGENRYIVAQVYNSSQLKSRFNIKISMLPLLPIILGCDWIEPGTLSRFSSSHYLKIDPQLRKNPDKVLRKRINLLFQWLVQQKSFAEVMNKIERFYSTDKKLLSQLRWCLDFFQNLPLSLECQSILKEQIEAIIKRFSPCKMQSFLASLSKKLKCVEIEDRAVCETRRGSLPSTMFSIYSGNTTVLLPVVVGSVSQHSMHACSYSIRLAAYRLINSSAILEYSQQARNYQAMKKGFPKDQLCSCQSLENIAASFSCVNKTKSDKLALRKYVLEILLGCEVLKQNVHSSYETLIKRSRNVELVLAATVHWIEKTKPPQSLISAVLLILSDWDSEYVLDLALLYPTEASSTCSVALIHRISEWQSCVKYTFILNKLLVCPLFEAKLSYNCSTISALTVRLSSQSNPLVLPSDIRQLGKLMTRHKELLNVIKVSSHFRGRRRGRSKK